MLTVVSPASSTRLASVTAVKQRLGLPQEDVEPDAALARLVDQASAAIVGYCCRPFALETVAETFRSDCALSALILSRTPVASITSVTAHDQALATDDYEVDADAGLIYRANGTRLMVWSHGRVVVVYSAGWILPGEAGRNLPADIEAACCEMVAAGWNGAGRDPMLRSEMVEGVGRNDYFGGGTNGGMPAMVVDLLAPHRRLGIG